MFEQIMHLWMLGEVDIHQSIRELKYIGVDGIDLSVSLSNRHNSIEVINDYVSNEIFKKADLPVRVLTPIYKEPELDLSSPNRNVFEKAIKFTCECIDLACRLSVDRMLVSPSYIGVDHLLHKSYKDDWDQAVTNLRILANYAEQKNVILMLEPINRYLVSLIHTVDEGLKMIDCISSPNVSLVLDAFHMNIEEEDITKSIRRANGKIFSFHLGTRNRKPPLSNYSEWNNILCALLDSDFSGFLSHEPIELYYSENRMITQEKYRTTFLQQLKSSITFIKEILMNIEKNTV